jgi:hypothetical protein
MLTRFFNLTGLTPETIREAAENPGFHASVLDHFLADETLLVQFTQSTGLRRDEVSSARESLERGGTDGHAASSVRQPGLLPKGTLR